MRCSRCGRTWHVGGDACPYCGAPTEGQAEASRKEAGDHGGTSGGGALSRRRFLGGLALAGGAAGLAVAGLAATRTFLSQEPVQQVPQVTSHLVSGDLPVEDPYAVAWLRIGEQRLAMQVQNVVVPFKTGAALPTVSVRSLHNGREIAFRLEWEDPHLDDLTVRTDQFRDACGVLLGSPTAVWTMGSPDDPVTILHWKADWQRDLEQGYQDLEAAFPNAAFDFYPPLVGVARPSPEDYPPEARHRLPGLAVGNPLSQPRRPSAVEKLQAMGPGTILTLPTQDARGRGVWRDGRWAVVLTKRLEPSDQGELRLEPGGSYAVAFAVWLGSAGDRGARKSISQLGTLWLEASR